MAKTIRNNRVVGSSRESRDARGTNLLVLPFGELHVRLLQQRPKVRAVSLEPPPASERARRVGELAVLFIRLQREIP
jgi:hypothetical protein